MQPAEWEQTVQKIVDESHQHGKKAGLNKILVVWRAKLEQEPTHLPPYKIDEIMREVRRRLEARDGRL